MNDSTKRSNIRFAVDWLKGIKMDIPHSKWVMFAIGVYILAAAFDKVVGALVPLMH